MSDHPSLVTPDPDRAALRHDLLCAVRQFQADGGVIERVPAGATGPPANRSFNHLEKRERRGGR